LTDTTNTQIEDQIPYEVLVQNALLSVVERTLRYVADRGGMLPGEHHFFISFMTNAPDVDVPEFLRGKFPEEMTIALQHRFHDLVVTPDHFEVTLSFNSRPARISVPYDAVTNFLDPSVDFGLEFRKVGHTANDTGGAECEDAKKNKGDTSETGNVVNVDFGKK
jgi:hypothetical protein